MEESEVKSVSVVMATYNGERFIREQLDSILAQSYPITELIIQDDCSTDSTLQIVTEYAKMDNRIKVFRNEKNLGFVKNFESACLKASGDYIALSDQDDIWEKDHIEILVNLIGSNLCACGAALLVDGENHSLRTTLFEAKGCGLISVNNLNVGYRILYYSNVFQGASMLLEKDGLKDLLPFPSEVQVHDVWLALVASLKGSFVYTNQIITRHRRHSTNSSDTKKIPIVMEIARYTHRDYPSDRVDLAFVARKAGIENKILDEFVLYAGRCTKIKYRLWCFHYRFILHYKDIYSSKIDIRYFLRAIHFLLTPSKNKPLTKS